MRITAIECDILLDPADERDATSSSQDDARACIEPPGTHTMDLGPRETLLGEDPLDPSPWSRLYVDAAKLELLVDEPDLEAPAQLAAVTPHGRTDARSA